MRFEWSALYVPRLHTSAVNQWSESSFLYISASMPIVNGPFLYTHAAHWSSPALGARAVRPVQAPVTWGDFSSVVLAWCLFDWRHLITFVRFFIWIGRLCHETRILTLTQHARPLASIQLPLILFPAYAIDELRFANFVLGGLTEWHIVPRSHQCGQRCHNTHAALGSSLHEQHLWDLLSNPRLLRAPSLQTMLGMASTGKHCSTQLQARIDA